MPLSFIFLTILLVFSLIYKNVTILNLPRVLFFTIILTLLCGFFIAPVPVGYLFSLNVIFACCSLFLFFELWFKLKFKKKLYVFLFAFLSLASYFVLVLINTDYYSFLTYLPVTLVVSVLSLIFVKNLKGGISFILLSFILIEWANYFYGKINVGYLTLFNYEFLNAITISVLFFSIMHLAVKQFSNLKVKHKKYGEVNYEKK